VQSHFLTQEHPLPPFDKLKARIIKPPPFDKLKARITKSSAVSHFLLRNKKSAPLGCALGGALAH
jgi:hypothetical protein